MRVFPADARKESIHQRFLSPLPYDGSGSVGVKREEEKKTRYPAPGISPRRWILTRNCPARSPSLTASQKGSGTSPGREKGKHSHSSRYTGADPPPRVSRDTVQLSGARLFYAKTARLPPTLAVRTGANGRDSKRESCSVAGG